MTLGRSNTSMVEIVDGLAAADHVLMHANEQLLARLPTADAADDDVNKAAAKHKPQHKPVTQDTSSKKLVAKEVAKPRQAPAGGGAGAARSSD